MSPDLRPAAANLLAAAGFGGDFSIHPLAGAANNRVFRVDTDGSSVLLKAYFRHPDDPRDRLETEFGFSRFAWENGVRCLPSPLACDPENHLGLFEFVHGRRLLSREVNGRAVKQALKFFIDLNRSKRAPGAESLPRASESCFSIAEHLGCVERRLRCLRGAEIVSSVDREAGWFIERDLCRVWSDVEGSVRRWASTHGLDLEAPMPAHERCLSPSDFGFHNAILARDGHLRFIDFEYAGWDDPAKMVCDFFCQPALPVPLEYFEEVVGAAVCDLPAADIQRQRAACLLPLYRVKWCCIMLNEFIGVNRERRRFSQGGGDPEERKAAQLQKARAALGNVHEIPGASYRR
jgi:hypothetical protein